jgi:hypothetical protein
MCIIILFKNRTVATKVERNESLVLRWLVKLEITEQEFLVQLLCRKRWEKKEWKVYWIIYLHTFLHNKVKGFLASFTRGMPSFAHTKRVLVLRFLGKMMANDDYYSDTHFSIQKPDSHSQKFASHGHLHTTENKTVEMKSILWTRS